MSKEAGGEDTSTGGDVAAYLDGIRHTRITGASDWATLGTQEVNPDGASELSARGVAPWGAPT